MLFRFSLLKGGWGIGMVVCGCVCLHEGGVFVFLGLGEEGVVRDLD